jgi:type II secretory pathway component PulF
MDTTESIMIVVGLLIALFLACAVLLTLRGKLPRYSFDGVILLLGLIAYGAVLFVLLIWLGPFGIAWWVVAVYAVIEWHRKKRASRQTGLLWMLTIAAERSMPLAPAVEAFANEQGGSFSWKARELAQMLNSGVPLPEALDRCPCLLPASAIPMVRVGCEMGTLASALRQAATAENVEESLWATIYGKIAYLFFLPIIAFLVITFVMIWIVPRFEKIFHDFGRDLPEMTQWLVSTAYFLCNYWYVFSPIFLIILGVLVHVTLRYLGWIDTDLPWIGRLMRRLDTAQILDTLAVVAGQKRPLSEGIASLARTYPKSDVRQRLCLAVAETEAGRDWCDSFQRQGLIQGVDKSILQAASRVGNLPWAMRELADSNRRRFAYRLQAFVQTLFPPAMILLGLLVMFIVVSLFLPLIELIISLAKI